MAMGETFRASMLRSTDPYYEAWGRWRSIRNRTLVQLLLVLAPFVGVFWLFLAVEGRDKLYGLYIQIFMVTTIFRLLFAADGISKFECPRCGEQYFSGICCPKCSHCGLPKWAPRDLDLSLEKAQIYSARIKGNETPDKLSRRNLMRARLKILMLWLLVAVVVYGAASLETRLIARDLIFAHRLLLWTVLSLMLFFGGVLWNNRFTPMRSTYYCAGCQDIHYAAAPFIVRPEICEHCGQLLDEPCDE